MLLKKGCPDEHVSNLDALDHIFSIGFARADGAQDAAVVGNGARGCLGRHRVSNSIKYVSKTGGCLSDLLDYLRVSVVECFLRSIRFDEVMVLRTAGRNDF